MFKNALVGVDGRPNGRDAIALASRLTDPDGKLTLAHVHSGELRPSHAITPGLVAEEREDSHKLLERERTAAEVSAELISVVSMEPGRGLHEQAEEQGPRRCRRTLHGRSHHEPALRAKGIGAPEAQQNTNRHHPLVPCRATSPLPQCLARDGYQC
jgi:hypothetical protein